jgi:eukaryotic-like serine/threonine-protein kinase
MMRAGDIVGGRFLLDRLAGSGGMGDVFRAIDRETGSPVALKVLRDEAQDDAARFAREARLLAELGHPRIVRHVDNGVTEAGHSWIAMEWLEGEDLAARLLRGPLRVDESVTLAIGLAARGRSCAGRRAP